MILKELDIVIVFSCFSCSFVHKESYVRNKYLRTKNHSNVFLFLLWLSEYIDEDGVRWTTERTKPSLSILGEYTVTWKPRCNHFLRHSDVRPKG